MKPKEFDDLVRRRFDQGDFEYNPGNWERLAVQMDKGKEKKRSIMVWWGLPLAGIAASVTLAMGLMFLWHNYPAGHTAGTAAVATHTAAPGAGAQQAIVPAAATNDMATNNTANSSADRSPASAGASAAHTKAVKTRNTSNKPGSRNSEDLFSISYANAVGRNNIQPASSFDFMNSENAKKDIAKIDKKKDVLPVAVVTFKEEQVVKKVAKLSVILSGGINRGTQNNGYMAGATIRKMVNSNVYVESDVAFASSTNTQATAYLVNPASSGIAAKGSAAARGANMESSKPASVAAPAGIIKEENVSYNLNYVQVTPSVGVKIMKRMSLGAGPDFQQVLADNRPAPSTVERGNIQVAPLFDVGLIGKSEYAITQKVRAAVSYRKGINNVITPMDKYIERDYLQFQVKCLIFNK